jgi:signal transduction histidine kinase
MGDAREVDAASTSLEQAFLTLLGEVARCQGLSLKIVVLGKPCALNAATQEQIFLIGREAIINALRHSRSTTIEVEVQYLRDLLCLLVRDNGCGINPDEILRVRDSHWGLRRMRNQAENIGARFGIWSWPGAGTEVRVAMPVDVTNRRGLIHIVSMCFGCRNRR